MKTFKIDDIPEFSKKERIVVVGVIGKTPYRYPNKTAPLLGQVSSEETGIECHWDERRAVLYLHAVTYLDTKQLVKLASNLDEKSKSTHKDADAADWLVASGELAMESCKVMGLLFNLCHIVVLSSPTPVFDIEYLQLFKAIDAFRLELAPRITTALTDANVGGAWETHGRCCCPRLLFHSRGAPAPLIKVPAALKRLEHAVEDQLYLLLRKARIITNLCAKSLFAIPKNEEFVYINTERHRSERDMSSLLRGLVQLCGDIQDSPPARPSFSQFLQGHVDLAFTEGFDDNVVKYAMSTSFFELPSAATWRTAAKTLVPIYLESSTPEDEQSPGGALYDALATDVRFSEARCAKVLPIAQASYTEGLPSHYSSQHHAHKLASALLVVESMARGPLARGACDRLRSACVSVWHARMLCEAASLTGHPCILPQHDSSKEHSSGVRYISACNCGRTKCSRTDPYTVKDANYTFYVHAASECGVCDTLQQIQFPVFEPSTPTYRAASVRDGASQDEAADEQDDWSADALSDRSPASPRSDTPTSTKSDAYHELPLNDTDEAVRVTGDKSITRQPSTTEYLPGMLHSTSPAGLLPAFSSWSLVCVGASSLYSHSAGLSDAMQPGFLPHTNYMQPWDCSVKLEQVAAWRAAQAAARGRAKSTALHHLTVKIFLGFEYECPRGHRFMMSSPESVTCGGGGAGAGARLAAASMPLRAGCGARCVPRARLTRVHVVTPKAPVHVTLRPRLQPYPGGPIFSPLPPDAPPAKLSASAYWILRVPHTFCCERGVVDTQHRGAVVPPMFGLQE